MKPTHASRFALGRLSRRHQQQRGFMGDTIPDTDLPAMRYFSKPRKSPARQAGLTDGMLATAWNERRWRVLDKMYEATLAMGAKACPIPRQ